MRILLIEDEEKTVTSLRQGLTEAGFAVDLARRRDEGLARGRTGEHDLIVLDIMLPTSNSSGTRGSTPGAATEDA